MILWISFGLQMNHKVEFVYERIVNQSSSLFILIQSHIGRFNLRGKIYSSIANHLVVRSYCAIHLYRLSLFAYEGIVHPCLRTQIENDWLLLAESLNQTAKRLHIHHCCYGEINQEMKQDKDNINTFTLFNSWWNGIGLFIISDVILR